MLWQIGKTHDSLTIEVPELFFDWLVLQSSDKNSRYLVSVVDPYQDTQLDNDVQKHLLQILSSLYAKWLDELQKKYIHLSKASTPEIRNQILESLIKQELPKDPFMSKCAELIAFLEISIEIDSLVESIGD